jgi:serpin B
MISASSTSGTEGGAGNDAAAGDDAGAGLDSASLPPTVDAGSASEASLSDPAQLEAGNTMFAFALYHALTGKDPTLNLAFSPYSVSVALAMAYAGAAGSTATQMASALDFDLPAARLPAAFQAIDQDLASRGQSGLTLQVVDSLWVDQSLTLLQPFVDTLSNDYGAPPQAVDFLNAPDSARAAIDAWVSNATGGNIASLFPAGSITSQMRVVLADATYLDAGWLTYFNGADTGSSPFTRLDGSVVQATTMGNGAIPLPYAETGAYQAVEMPYVGGKTSMVVLLPAAGLFGAVEPALGSDLYQTLTGSLVQANVVLNFPKFALSGATTSLRPALTSLGMTDAFVRGAADFSALSTTSLWLEDVIQQTNVAVDEMGTKATAATGASLGWYGSVTYPSMVYFKVDRPFFFFIRDIPTNTLLFVGRVTDPTQ